MPRAQPPGTSLSLSRNAAGDDHPSWQAAAARPAGGHVELRRLEPLTPCLQSTSRLSATVDDPAIGTSARRSQTGSVRFRCGQPWWSASRRWRPANHLIRRELRAHPLPGHTSVDLLKCASSLSAWLPGIWLSIPLVVTRCFATACALDVPWAPHPWSGGSLLTHGAARSFAVLAPVSRGPLAGVAPDRAMAGAEVLWSCQPEEDSDLIRAPPETYRPEITRRLPVRLALWMRL